MRDETTRETVGMTENMEHCSRSSHELHGTHDSSRCFIPHPSSLIPFVLLALLILLIYYPALFAQFNWDDLEIIGHNYMRSLGGLKTIWLSPSQSICGDYWPINYTSHWIEYQLWGLHPLGYHAVNIVLHWANACILLYLLQRISVRGALLVAILFAIHPTQISSVAWAVERKDLLNTFFYLLTFGAWMRFEKERSIKCYLVVFLFFTASLLSKSMSITWPVAALIYSWWRVGRIEWRRVLPLAPLLALGFIPVWFSMQIHQKNDSALPAEFVFSLPEKLILVGKNLAFYSGKLFWPIEHFAVYPHWAINAHQCTHYVPFAGAVVLLTTLWSLQCRVGRGPFAALAFYILTLSPILGLVPWGMMRITYVQDHYQYLACVGPFLLFAYAVDAYALRWVNLKTVCVALTLALFLPLVILANRHTRLYYNSETLFTENYRRYPTAPVAVLLGAGLARNGKPEAGLALLDEALAKDPTRILAWKHKGDVLSSLGRNVEAAVAYKQALSLNKRGMLEINIFNAYVTALVRTPSPNIAPVLPLLEKALGNDPRDSRTETNLAIVLSLAGRKDEARAHFEHVIKTALKETPPDAFYYYGKLRLENGEVADALPFLRLAQRVAPCPEYQAAIQQAETIMQNANSAVKK